MSRMDGGGIPRGRFQWPRFGWLAGAAGAAFVAILAGAAPVRVSSAESATEPLVAGGQTTVRRLNEAQYRRSIQDIFGAGLTVPGRFDPPLRDGGLLAIGSGKATVSTSGFEQYELRSREIAAQVLDTARRDALLRCKPASPKAFDGECAGSFIGKYGRLLYRRPLSDHEKASVMAVAKAATAQTGDFHQGMQAALARMLSSPNFVFRVERSEPDPARAGLHRLDGFSLASRISFLLWDAPPDEALLDAAASGALRDPAVLNREVDRMISSPRFTEGARAFFADMYGLDRFAGLAKDQAIFPKYTPQLAKDAQEQLLRTVIDHLVAHNGDYRGLFTTRKTFMTRNLASLYRVPMPDGGEQGWVPYTFGDGDAREGILSLAGFLMLDPTHEGRSSPTIRGLSVRERFMCEPVPVPPANVNFSIVQNTNDPLHRTARDRLKLHSEDPSCSSCHKITDPIGLSMENYDAIGAFRTHENGALIDAGGQIDGRGYQNLLGLTSILHENVSVASCVVQRAYEYGVGRTLSDDENRWLDYAIGRFAQDGYQYPMLMRRIATSHVFQSVGGQPPMAARAGSVRQELRR